MSATPEKKYDRRVSKTYEVIIVAGFIILFVQLYQFAQDRYNDNQFTQRIESFEQSNTEKLAENERKPVQYLQTLLRSWQIREEKETNNRRYRDEEVMIIPDAERKAHENMAPSEDDIFKQPQNIEVATAADMFIAEMKKKPKPAQWKFFLFHLD